MTGYSVYHEKNYDKVNAEKVYTSHHFVDCLSWLHDKQGRVADGDRWWVVSDDDFYAEKAGCDRIGFWGCGATMTFPELMDWLKYVYNVENMLDNNLKEIAEKRLESPVTEQMITDYSFS